MITLLDDYQEQAFKTMNAREKTEMDKYICMKLAEEVGELNGMVAKHYFHGKPWDHENCKEELSDILWYVSAMAKVNGLTLSEIATYNIEKLRKRHGSSYNENYYKV